MGIKLDEIRFYYGNYRIQHLLIKYLKDRELALLSPKAYNFNYAIRNLRVHNTQSMQFWLKYIRMFDSPSRAYNLYYSMAKFEDGIPYRNVKDGNLKEDWAEWNKKAKESIIEYDMLIDIDAGDFSEMDAARMSAINIKQYLDFKDAPYYLRYSGMGFHFVIPYRFFPRLSCAPDMKNNIYRLMKKLAKYLYDHFSEMVDLTIYDSRRIAKLPYSLSLYDSGAYVCCPIHELKDFDFTKMKLGNFKYPDSFYADMLHNASGDLKGLFEKV